jgi:hypothetical protein
MASTHDTTTTTTTEPNDDSGMADRFYVYKVEGELYGGTLQSWADAAESAHYSGLSVEGPWLIEPTADGISTTLVVPSASTSDSTDDYRTVFYTHGTDTARQRIDLRA